ncbi:MAG: DUF120 domain-containing protein [Candidatus Lokiarchaeota archaeon]|nr:DUF120 domain-containing protein [Candidatus Lokiarchaeota archaeon]
MDHQWDFDEKEWFLLLYLAKSGAVAGIKTTTQEIADAMGSTQQTISRRLRSLIDEGYVSRSMEEKTPFLKITAQGIAHLKSICYMLNDIFEENTLETIFYGKVVTGMGEGAYYISLSQYYNAFKKFLGSEPFLGTLNIVLDSFCVDEYYFKLGTLKPEIIKGFETDNRTFGPVKCYYVYVCRDDDRSNCIKSLILDIRRTSHAKGTVEIVSDRDLRETLQIGDDSRLGIKFIENN